MTMKLPLVLALFISVVYLSVAQQQYVYTIQYIRSFNRDKIQKSMGCNYSSIAYATYIYPNGPKDGLYVHINRGTFQHHTNCPFKNLYAKLFGMQQNYDQLLTSEPQTVANKIKQQLARMNANFIVDWNCPLQKEAEKARNWLNTFVQKLSGNAQVYVKAPASYFCYLVNGQKYLLDLSKVNKLIIEMYGEQPDVYTTYEEIFQHEQPRQSTNKEKYGQNCAQFPSYQTLVKNNPDKQFFIEKTLQKEEPGYIGPKFRKYLQKAGKIYEKQVFLDSFPLQIIQL